MAVGQVGDEEGEGIAEGAPGQEIAELHAGDRAWQRVLNEEVRRNDHQGHECDVDKERAVDKHFFILGDATSCAEARLGRLADEICKLHTRKRLAG